MREASNSIPANQFCLTFSIPASDRTGLFRLGGIVLKRSVDLSLGGLLAVLTLPLLAVAAVLIKLDSRGPVLFFQVRMGRGFRPFDLVKLRTMRLSGGSAYTLGADPRITRVGRWLRRLKFDELPQLWNVLRGEMSIVGPRPVIPELTVEFRQEYERLLQVRPGLTDPATIRYCRETELLAQAAEPLRYFKTVVVPEKLRVSREYLEGATVWSDFGVMLATFAALLPIAGSRGASRPVPVSNGDRSAVSADPEPRWHVHAGLESALIATPGEVLSSVDAGSGRPRHIGSNLLA
jgi:lipopolysaccharide/colanic/teichoic acid biosynthesis glycosyltransferase